MKQSAISVIVFGLYMGGRGVLLMLAPNILLGLFGIPDATEIWIKIVGIALIILAYYYIRCSLSGNEQFFQYTTQGRFIQFLLFIVLVISTGAPLILIGLSGIEFLSGVWTYFALESEKPK